jgi:hypothetical protein
MIINFIGKGTILPLYVNLVYFPYLHSSLMILTPSPCTRIEGSIQISILSPSPQLHVLPQVTNQMISKPNSDLVLLFNKIQIRLPIFYVK